MMVIFTSCSEKKALSAVRRVLDLFAERIGDDTWRTSITAEGLKMVHMLLRRTATKNTAVACHWIRSRSRSELLWVVGKREAFNITGAVPVHITQVNHNHREWENEWILLPFIQTLVATAALFHDWGKASAHFQKKLKQHSLEADPFRHEWVSVKLIEAVVAAYDAWDDDRLWLQPLADGSLDVNKVMEALDKKRTVESCWKCEKLPAAAALLVWLIVSHHRLPVLEKEERKPYKNMSWDRWDKGLEAISARWGYQNASPETGMAEDCFRFPQGILFSDARIWTKRVRKWTGRLLAHLDCMQEKLESPAFRWILQSSRLCLMLGDHYISSLPKQKEEALRFPDRGIWANSDPSQSTFQGRQSLEEHLVRVCDQAAQIAYQLPRFVEETEKVRDVRILKRPSPSPYTWQDKAAEKITRFRKEKQENPAWFIVNMASTGCGKTMANAKLMAAVSEDGCSLRYNLALGLRTLTLQTGDEYRKRIGLDSMDMAVLIGSSAVRELYEKRSGMAEAEDLLLGQTLDYTDTADGSQCRFMDLFFSAKNPEFGKNRAFLNKPVLVSTIDYLMKATETVRGGRYILPFLRLMSSDLVIDEIDDFDKTDLIAIARLVHLAGMMGRNAAISSATIPPDLAEGLYRCYMTGLSCYNGCFPQKKMAAVLLCDEFRATAALVNQVDTSPYRSLHDDFIKKRVQSLKKTPARRKGRIAPFSLQQGEAPEDCLERYFEQIKEEMLQLHQNHHIEDRRTGKRISIGVIRIANIRPCIALCRYLLQCRLPEDVAVRILPYHSRQILLLRNEEEQYLDQVLKRKVPYGISEDIQDPVLRKHIDQAEEKQILFVVVATPVEEVGRDHDFDWAVVEPSSYRSIIQLSGRVLRHRKMEHEIWTNNVTLMEYNILGATGKTPAFCRPGYETGGEYCLSVHSLKELLDESRIADRIDAVPRIYRNKALCPDRNLIDLEHKVMEDFNSSPEEGRKSGPESVDGWIRQFWWMTALPQRFQPFRKQTQREIHLYGCLENGDTVFYEERDGKKRRVNELYNIHQAAPLTPDMERRLWLHRNYDTALRAVSEGREDDEYLLSLSRRFGEIVIPEQSEKQEWYYSEQFGLFQLV